MDDQRCIDKNEIPDELKSAIVTPLFEITEIFNISVLIAYVIGNLHTN